MKTVKQVKQDLDPDLFVRMVQNYPNRRRGAVIPFPSGKDENKANKEEAPSIYSVFFAALGVVCMVLSLTA